MMRSKKVSPTAAEPIFYFDQDDPDFARKRSDSDSSSEAVKPAPLKPTNTTPSTNGSASPRKSNRSSRPSFEDNYTLRDEILGTGAYAVVQACVKNSTGKEYAVKVIEKRKGNARSRVIREIDTFHMCSRNDNIVQLIEYYETADRFYLVFEKMRGGPLLSHIQRRFCFTEHEASLVTKDIATALKFLHDKGIAHRDIKPENCLCTYPDKVSPVKLCDLDLASTISNLMSPSARANAITTPELQSPVGSAEFMAPEVVDAFVGESLTYDKRCDMWSLGVIIYIMLCGYPPFYGECWRQGKCGWDEGQPCGDCQESLFAKIQTGKFDFPEEDWGRISHQAKDLINHLLVKDARQRYSADEVLRHRWLTDDTPKTPLQTPDVLLRKESVRNLEETFNIHSRLGVVTRLSARAGLSGARPVPAPSVEHKEEEEDEAALSSTLLATTPIVTPSGSLSKAAADGGHFLQHKGGCQRSSASHHQAAAAKNNSNESAVFVRV